MAVDIKQSYRRLLEETFGKGNFDVFDEVCDPGFKGHVTLTGDSDLQHEKENCRMFRTAFPDLKCTILASFAEGDTVTTHWRMAGSHRGALTMLGMPPTGKRVTVDGISLGRFRSGKLVESWTQWDAPALLTQLGVLQPVATGAAPSETRPHA